MSKTYFNNAVIGNSSMLGCLTDRGELVRLFWPNIDYPQHLDSMLCGIFFTEQKHSTVWLNEDGFNHTQIYIEDTNMLKTLCTNDYKGLRVEQVDFVLPDRDVLIRQYEIQNTGPFDTELGFIVFSSGVTTNSHMGNVLFDFNNDALVHYRHGYYISISGNREVWQFQLGNNPYESARYTELTGYDSIGMMPDGAVSWKLEKFQPGEKKAFTLQICAAATLKEVKKLTRSVREADILNEYTATERYWKNYLKSALKISSGRKDIDELYKRSLLVFKLMSDEKTGGLLAAPELDEDFTRSGRYAYCWGRDAAFITSAMDKAGLTGAVEKFYQWAIGTQDEDGSWHQRYHMDGNLAPSWGLQIDETGTLVWGMLKHYEVTGDRSFLEKVWESVRKAVDFMVSFIDHETGLPKASFDLWEERFGEHAYSSAAVYAGINAGAQMARILGRPTQMIDEWEATAKGIRESMVKNLWKEDKGCFLRSIRTKLNPWGSEPSMETTRIKVNPKGYFRDVTLEDGTVDVSLLGMVIPFGVFGVEDDRITRTAGIIESVLTSQGSGGVKRYESDNYIGGNPWVLATLWIALYHIERKNFSKAREYFEWSIKASTELGLLPEQVSRDTGTPVWVIPLTWSHAMFVLVLMELVQAGAI